MLTFTRMRLVMEQLELSYTASQVGNEAATFYNDLIVPFKANVHLSAFLLPCITKKNENTCPQNTSIRRSW
jgi:hypothetical protein